eukprot:11809960-Heterocapsa_arctica.AAC.1
MEGCSDTPWDFEHMAGQSEAETQQKPQPHGLGALGAPPEAAPLCFVCNVFSHRFGRPRARNPMACRCAPLFGTGHIRPL